MNERAERNPLERKRRRASTLAPQTREEVRRSSADGNAATAVVALVFLVALGLGALFLVPARSTGPVSTTPSASPGGAPIEPAPPTVASDGGAPIDAVDLGERTRVGDGTGIEFRTPTDYAKSFDGFGTLLVDVRTEPGAPFPDAWTLHLEPSATQAGREHAESRTLEYPGPQRSVEVSDLPLGAYDVYATADGLSSFPAPVVLHGVVDNPHATGGMFKRMTMTMVGAPSVEVLVRRANGAPAEELDVHLRRAVGVGQYSARTDANGMANFTGVAPGAWLMTTGDAQRSWTTPQPVDVGSKPVRLDDVTLPALVDVEVTAIDDLERPLPGATMVGYRRANGSGRFEGTTDELGRLRVRYLPPGPWRFEGEHEELGLSGMRDHPLELEGEHSAASSGGSEIRLNVLLQPKTTGDN